MSGLIAAIQGYRLFSGANAVVFPDDTMIGALCKHISTDFGEYSPMNSNFGILTSLEQHIKDKSQRKAEYSKRALNSLKQTISNIGGI